MLDRIILGIRKHIDDAKEIRASRKLLLAASLLTSDLSCIRSVVSLLALHAKPHKRPNQFSICSAGSGKNVPGDSGTYRRS